MQMDGARRNIGQLCDALGIVESQHLPKSFRSLLPCSAALPGVVNLDASIIKHHKVDSALWNALGPSFMRIASGSATAAAVTASADFEAAKRHWIATSGATNAKLRQEEAAKEKTVQVRTQFPSLLKLLIQSPLTLQSLMGVQHVVTCTSGVSGSEALLQCLSMHFLMSSVLVNAWVSMTI